MKQQIETWLQKNKMQPNLKKSTLLSFKWKPQATLLEIPLDSVNSQRDLGLVVSNKITWNEACSRQKTQAQPI